VPGVEELIEESQLNNALAFFLRVSFPGPFPGPELERELDGLATDGDI